MAFKLGYSEVSKTEYLPQKCYNPKLQRNALISEYSSNNTSITIDFKIQVEG